ncbi:hypothetical protein V491_03588 [Pseudogymnoascus sp. VKM F-3775]|nr:hypothetical protein V491_03588 [Pseudogymnoascus sp. VKM F-3775]
MSANDVLVSAARLLSPPRTAGRGSLPRRDVSWGLAWVAQDRVPKDVEHVMPVVGEGKGMDERVEVDDADTERDGEEGPYESASSREGRGKERYDGRKEEGEGKE